MIGRTISHYRILEKLGEGGMGVVYRARDRKLKRDVALKFLAPDLTRDSAAKARFIREAEATSALDHPNICTLHAIEETEDGRLFLAMACYEGETLKDRLERGPLPVAAAVDIAAQVAAGLAKAHERGIAHRDIKPANVFITGDGLVKILDFGLAKLAGRAQLTTTGTTLGTVAYMSPEQVRGDESDGRTDLWSLGVVLFQMIGGRLPFRGEFDSAVIYNILNEAPAPLTSLRETIPVDLERVVDRCLAKDRRQRHQSAGELQADLHRLAASLQASADAATVSMPSRRAARRAGGRWLPRLGLVAAAALVIGTAAHFLPGSGTPPADGRIRLAVLPFANLGAPQDEAFCSGVTDVITARLAGIRGLGVVSRQSTLPYRGSSLSAPQIGRQLGVDYILEGTVQRENPAPGTVRVRIVPQLIRVADDTHVWAGTYDESLAEVFEAQTAIARRVAHALDITLQAPASLPSAGEYFDREQALQQARLSIVAAVAAYDRQPRDVETSRGLFTGAERALAACGLLAPGERRGDEIARAFRTIVGQTANRDIAGRDFARILASLAEEGDLPPASGGGYDLEDELSRILGEFGVDVTRQPAPAALVQRVRHYVDRYDGDWRDFTEAALARSRALLPMIHQELANYGLPRALAAMPLMLSGYDPDLPSPGGVRGLWRFLPQTARDYGLIVEPPDRDDRMDAYRETIAACELLDYLLKLFGSGDPLCAVAAYNCGAAGLARCLQDEGVWRAEWRCWDLVEKQADCLSAETSNFVPRFLAAAVVMRRPDAFGSGG